MENLDFISNAVDHITSSQEIKEETDFPLLPKTCPSHSTERFRGGYVDGKIKAELKKEDGEVISTVGDRLTSCQDIKEDTDFSTLPEQSLSHAAEHFKAECVDSKIKTEVKSEDVEFVSNVDSCPLIGERFTSSQDIKQEAGFHEQDNEMMDSLSCSKSILEGCTNTNEVQTLPDERMITNNHVYSQCSYEFTSKSKCEQYLKTHSENLQFHCDSCQFKTKHLSTLHSHKKTHQGSYDHRCNQCDEKFVSETDLLRHLQNRYSCDFKTKIYGNIPTHKHSMGKTQGHTRFYYWCEQCDAKFVFKSDLMRHLRTHCDEKQFECDSCDFKSKYLSNLYTHKKRHNGNYDQYCQKCDAKFLFPYALRCHMRTHSDE